MPSEFQWAFDKAAKSLRLTLPHCFGGEGLGILMKQVQNEIIGKGYVTTRVVVEEQDLRSGKLVLIIAISYSGESETDKLTLSYLFYRDAKRKTSLSGSLWSRQSQNYIDGAEIEVQKRRMAGWVVGFNPWIVNSRGKSKTKQYYLQRFLSN